MKLSTNFLKDYIDIDVDVKQLAEDMTRVGNEYDSASNLINATKLVIGQITECEPHPDSDHLHLCKVNIGTEVLGAGIVHPNVLKMNGYDPEKFGGFAFGTGIDRLAMFRYGITDMRYLYTNDVRFLSQFDRKDEE